MGISKSDGMLVPASTRIDATFAKDLIVSLSPFLEFKTFPTGMRFKIDNKNVSCYLIRTGAIAAHRLPGDILIDIFDAPTIRGMIPFHAESKSSYIMKVVMPSEIAIIDKELFYNLLSEKQLWRTYAHHMEAVACVVPEIIYKLTSSSSFDIVLLQLIELMNKPLEIRENISAENYIREKTRLSRSGILRTLSILRSDGVIIIEKGILKHVKY